MRSMTVLALISTLGGGSPLMAQNDPPLAPSLQWEFRASGPLRSLPLVTKDRVYFTSGDGHAYALDHQGHQIWSQPLAGGASFASASLGPLGLYIVSGGSTLERLDPATGSVLASLQTGPNVQVDEWDYFHSSPLVQPDHVVFGSGDGFLYAVDRLSLKVKWKVATQPGENAERVAPVHSSPVAHGNLIYVVSAYGDLFAVDSAGKKVGRFRLGDRVDGNVVIDQGQLFVGSRNTQFYGIDLSPLAQKWSFRSMGGSWMTSTAWVGTELVVAGSSDDLRVYAWNRTTGETLWRAPVSGNVFSQVVAYGSALIVTSGNARESGHGVLTAFDQTTGRELWQLPLADNSWATPSVVGNLIYVGDESGTLRCYRGELPTASHGPDQR